MSGPIVEWLEPFSPASSGVDHLGMRVAGEQAYAQLIDFTTTVSFRPRYFSFLCWALHKAFIAAGGRECAVEHSIDLAERVRALKRYDFVMAAATLAADPNAERIAGNRRIQRLLTSSGEDGTIPVTSDHLRAPHGSFDTYAGPMSELGLLRAAGGVTRPSALGMKLALAFERTLHACAGNEAFSADAIPLTDLLRIGELCGISRFRSDEEVMRGEVHAEREALRSVIIDFDGFHAHKVAVVNRLYSIAIILRLHEMKSAPTLHEFRTVTLLDGLRTDAGVISLGLPPACDRVRSHWRVYQAHAYATLALEGLLCIVIEHAFKLQPTLGEVLPTERIADGVLALLAEGQANATGAVLLNNAWWEGSVEEIVSCLDSVIGAHRDAEVAEPELGQAVYSLFTDIAAGTHDACLLFLLSCARMRTLLQTDGQEAWTGENEPPRLPPLSLVAALEDAVCRQQTGRAFLRDVIVDFVIRQHRKTALRKLAADPSRDTSKLLLEAGGLIPLMRHSAGTSNPRYANAVLALTDLGYLTPYGTLAADGEVLLNRLARGRPA